MSKIFITGGAGYIGSHCVVSLIQNGYEPIILDNFSNSCVGVIKKLEIITKKKIIFYNLDIKNKKKLKLIFKKHNCSAVIHCAGFKSVRKSMQDPIKYFENNIMTSLSLIECMQEKKIFNLIFSSSATVYNFDQRLPWKETDNIGKTINPYGTSKYIIERILQDLVKSDMRWRVGVARYFNPISNHCSGLISDNSTKIPENLLPYIVKVAQKKLPHLKIYGKNYFTRDGTCIRDYIHVMDLAEGHVALLKKNKLKKGIQIYNFGSGKGLSVLDIIKGFQKYAGISIPFRFFPKRKGDLDVYFCCPKKAYKKLSWKASRNLNQAILDIKSTI
jgi:UDP-glucose 4-epimerase